MDSRDLFPELDISGSADPTDVGCFLPGCGKIWVPNSPHCPHHATLAEWKKGEPARRKSRRKLLQEMRELKEDLLRESPLAAFNPRFHKPKKQKPHA
jgi:hypothetical protein